MSRSRHYNLPPLPKFAEQRPDKETGLLCKVCGQAIDTTDQDQVFHHGPEPHEPLRRHG